MAPEKFWRRVFRCFGLNYSEGFVSIKVRVGRPRSSAPWKKVNPLGGGVPTKSINPMVLKWPFPCGAGHSLNSEQVVVHPETKQPCFEADRHSYRLMLGRG